MRRTSARGAPALALLAALAVWTCASPAPAAQPDAVRFGIAVEQGDIGRVKEWLDSGLDPDYMADRIGSGLMISAWEGNVPMMELFYSRGARIDLVNSHDEQALQLAAWKGNIDAVDWLLAHGASVNRGGSRWGALHYAAFADRRDVARLLIRQGGDVNARAPNGSTALMMTAREGREDLARLLLEAGADARLTNENGESALVWAMRHGHFRVARLVSSAAEFAQAARAAPESFGTPDRSQPSPPEIEEILRQIRLAQAAGMPVDELRKKFFDAVARFRQASQREVIASRGKRPSGRNTKQGRPKALMITAERRGRKNAGGERAELIYRETPRAAVVENVIGSTVSATPQASEVPEILERIANARAAGRPTDDLRRALFEAVARFKQAGAAKPDAPEK